MSINEHPGRRAAAKVFDLLFIRSEKLVDVDPAYYTLLVADAAYSY
jgi:hypothetical protein